MIIDINKYINRTYICILYALLICLLCVGCGKSETELKRTDKKNTNIEKESESGENRAENELVIMGLYDNNEIRKEVSQYNKEHEDIKIKLVSYESEIDPETKLSTEIAAGNVPDIYILDMNGFGNLSINDCISKGMFENIRTYIEEDSEINEKDINPYILNNMLIDEKLYTSCGFVNLHTVVVKKDDYSNKLIKTEKINYSDFMDYVDARNSRGAIFFSDSPKDELESFLQFSMGTFIDGNNKCDFNNDSFIKMLELCKRGDCFPCDESTLKKLLEDDSVLCLEIDGDIMSLQLAEYGFGKCDKINMIGYPETGTLISYDGALAMSTTCKNKEAAWEFMRVFMTKEYESQNYCYQTGAIPIRNDAIQAYLEMYKYDDIYIDSFGNEDIDGKVGSGMAVGDMVISVKPLSEDEEKLFYDMVKNIGGTYGCNKKLSEIITEEAQSFFNGNKSAEEVAKIVQDKVSTYLNEQY